MCGNSYSSPSNLNLMPKVLSVSRLVRRVGQEAVFGILARAQELESMGRSVVHLEIGEPDFDTPAHVRRAAVEAIMNGDTHYTPTPGIPELRETIAEIVGRRSRVDVAWHDNVVVTVGAKE